MNPETGRGTLGSALVALQFSLIALVGTLAAPAFIGGQAAAGAWMLFSAGLLLMLWALYCNRPGNFNIHPAPRDGGQLVQQGPYRWVRHPMYSAVFACALGCLWARPSLAVAASAAALMAVLAIKASLEERWMLAAHAGYAAYRARSWRFVPGLY
jgi:protein-S-isoprenylcysteine O-methyltransferase Ste14